MYAWLYVWMGESMYEWVDFHIVICIYKKVRFIFFLLLLRYISQAIPAALFDVKAILFIFSSGGSFILFQGFVLMFMPKKGNSASASCVASVAVLTSATALALALKPAFLSWLIVKPGGFLCAVVVILPL